jgi:hypothetical protein
MVQSWVLRDSLRNERSIKRNEFLQKRWFIEVIVGGWPDSLRTC